METGAYPLYCFFRSVSLGMVADVEALFDSLSNNRLYFG